MDWLIKRGCSKQVPIKIVEKAIVCVRGPDPRTIQNWLKALEVLGFLERVNASIYQMDLSYCDEVSVKALDEAKQKTLG